MPQTDDQGSHGEPWDGGLRRIAQLLGERGAVEESAAIEEGAQKVEAAMRAICVEASRTPEGRKAIGNLGDIVERYLPDRSP